MKPLKENPIGVIDSGLGGLSIVSALIKNLPKESYIYLADSKNCPYGGKSEAEIYKLTKKMVTYLLKKRIKLIVVACNTITVTSIDKLRKEFKENLIIGIVPVIKTAREKTKNGKIGIFSTVVTANSSYQSKLINKFSVNSKVVNIGSSSLVPLIEKGEDREIGKVLKEELKVFKKEGVDALVLGCSHYPLIKRKIEKYLPDVLILDSSEAVARQVRRILENNNLLSSLQNPEYNFFTTGNDMEIFIKFIKHTIGNKLTNNVKIERISLQ